MKKDNLCQFFAKWIGIFLILVAMNALASTQKTAAGYWQVIDNVTNKPGGIIKIYRYRGKYYGKIVENSPHLRGKNPRCSSCQDHRKGKSFLGLTILRGFIWNPKDRRYEKGLILDPRTGKEYRCYMVLSHGGQKLYVRGYLGISLLGKTTVWTRVK